MTVVPPVSLLPHPATPDSLLTAVHSRHHAMFDICVWQGFNETTLLGLQTVADMYRRLPAKKNMAAPNLYIGGMSVDSPGLMDFGQVYVTTSRSDLGYFNSRQGLRSPTRVNTFAQLKSRVKTMISSNHLEVAIDGSALTIAAFGMQVRHGDAFRVDVTTPQHGCRGLSPMVMIAFRACGTEHPPKHLIDAAIMWALHLGPGADDKEFKGGTREEVEVLVLKFVEDSQSDEMSTQRAEAQAFMKCHTEALRASVRPSGCCCPTIARGEHKACMLGWRTEEEVEALGAGPGVASATAGTQAILPAGNTTPVNPASGGRASPSIGSPAEHSPVGKSLLSSASRKRPSSPARSSTSSDEDALSDVVTEDSKPEDDDASALKEDKARDRVGDRVEVLTGMINQAADAALVKGPDIVNNLARREMHVRLHDDAENADLLKHKMVFGDTDFRAIVEDARQSALKNIFLMVDAIGSGVELLETLKGYSPDTAMTTAILDVAVVAMVDLALTRRTAREAEQSALIKEQGRGPPDGFVWERIGERIIASVEPRLALQLNGPDPMNLIGKCVILTVANEKYNQTLGVVNTFNEISNRYQVTIAALHLTIECKPEALTEVTAAHAIMGRSRSASMARPAQEQGARQTERAEATDPKRQKTWGQGIGDKLQETTGSDLRTPPRAPPGMNPKVTPSAAAAHDADGSEGKDRVAGAHMAQGQPKAKTGVWPPGAHLPVMKAQSDEPLLPEGPRDPGMVAMVRGCADRLKLAQAACDAPMSMTAYHRPLLFSMLGNGALPRMRAMHREDQERRRLKDGPGADTQGHLGIGKMLPGEAVNMGDTSCFQCGQSTAVLPQGTFHVTRTVKGIREVVPMKDMEANRDCNFLETCALCAEWDDVIGDARYQHTKHMCPFEPTRFRRLAMDLVKQWKPVHRSADEPKRERSPRRSPRRDQSPRKSERRDRRDRSRSRSRSKERGARSSAQKRDEERDGQSLMSEESPNKSKAGSAARR